MALAPLHKKFKMKRVIVSTYQSVSGTGRKAVRQLENEMAGIQEEMAYPYPIHKNALPHCDVFEDNGYTKEEMKLMREPQKILNDDTRSEEHTSELQSRPHLVCRLLLEKKKQNKKKK